MPRQLGIGESSVAKSWSFAVAVSTIGNCWVEEPPYREKVSLEPSDCIYQTKNWVSTIIPRVHNALCTGIIPYLTGATAFSEAYVGRGTGGIFLDNVGCSGQEQYLINCIHSNIGVHNCEHSEDAGVFCVPQYPGTWVWIVNCLLFMATAFISRFWCICNNDTNNSRS